MTMKAALDDPELQKALVPDWAVGCRRLAPDTVVDGTVNRSYQAVKEENVHIVKTGVASFYVDGCRDENGKEYNVDVIICATGFNTSYIPRFPIAGQNGVELQEVWEHAPSSYLGVGVADFPNFFMMLGPYTPVANGPTMSAIGENLIKP
jgi:cation diffusion facilitator CzcD-associated flavoprotein CzcO